MRERHDAINVREVGQRLRKHIAPEAVGNGAGHGGRAIHRGQHADVVARGDAPVRPADAHEGGGLSHKGRGRGSRARCVAARKVGKREVVRVHMLARRDCLGGRADDLVVAPHGLAHANRLCSQLVARWHQARDGDAFLRNHRAAQQLAAGDDDVVRRVDADGGRNNIGRYARHDLIARLAVD